MATLGSSPSFNSWYFSDSGTSCATAPNQVYTNNYTMPKAGWVTAVVIYADGDLAGVTLHACVWNSSGTLLQSASVTVPQGSRSSSGQAWHTVPLAGLFLASGAVIKIGWTKPSGSSMVWAVNGSSGGNWGYGSDPGALSGCGAIGAPGAYIVYTAITAPAAVSLAASSVGSTIATLNGTVGDGGQGAAGGGNSSYYFQYGTSATLIGATNTSSTAFSGTGQAALTAITGLTVNTAYYFRVVSVNRVGTTYGSILSFSTLGLPNPPTLNTPINTTAQNAQTGGVAFAWTYNTGGAGGGETAYALKLTTGGVDYWWNGTALQLTEIYITTASTSVTVPAAILAPNVTYLWTVSSQDANGKGAYAPALTLISEGPPASPTLVSPTSGIYMDMTGATPTFVWIYNPGNAVGGQSNFAIRRKISGAGSYSYFNVGTNSWQGTIVWNSGSAVSYTFSAGLWIDGNTYNWSVATQDAGGQGSFASDFTVTAQAVPVVTVSAPIGAITNSKPNVVWATTFPSGVGETAYQVRTFSAAQYSAGGFNPATSIATDDSGAVTSGSTTSYQISIPLPAGSSYRSYVQVTETGSEPSGFLSFGAYTVTLDLPPTPTLTAMATTDPVTNCPMIQLTAQSLINLLSAVDASFETGIGTWGGLVNATIAQSGTQFLDGSFSLAMTSVLPGAMSTVTGYYSVLPSTQYSAGSFCRAAVSARTCEGAINWYDATHTYISQSLGTGVADTTSGWTQATVTATSPSNAAYALVGVIVVSTGGASEVHYLDEVGLFPGPSAAWSAGGFSTTAGIVILRSDGVYVRGASPVNTAPELNIPFPDTVIVNDYEVTPLTPYTYQALLQSTGSQGLVQSAYSLLVGASVSTNQWWEFDPTDPSGVAEAQPIQWNPSNTEQSTAHQVLGQSTMHVISSAMMGIDMTAIMEVFDAETWSDFYALATSQKTIFFSDPFGYSYYFRIAPGPGGMSSGMGNKAHDTQLLPSTAGGPHRTLAITGIAQPRPPV